MKAISSGWDVRSNIHKDYSGFRRILCIALNSVRGHGRALIMRPEVEYIDSLPIQKPSVDTASITSMIWRCDLLGIGDFQVQQSP